MGGGRRRIHLDPTSPTIFHVKRMRHPVAPLTSVIEPPFLCGSPTHAHATPASVLPQLCRLVSTDVLPCAKFLFHRRLGLGKGTSGSMTSCLFFRCQVNLPAVSVPLRLPPRRRQGGDDPTCTPLNADCPPFAFSGPWFRLMFLLNQPCRISFWGWSRGPHLLLCSTFNRSCTHWKIFFFWLTSSKITNLLTNNFQARELRV